jgi:hypothetical protein
MDDDCDETVGLCNICDEISAIIDAIELRCGETSGIPDISDEIEVIINSIGLICD